MPAFRTGFNEDCTLTSDGNIGAGTMKVSSAVSGVPEEVVVSNATVRSPGGPNKSVAKSAPVKIAFDVNVNAEAISSVMAPNGVVLLPTTRPGVPKLLSAPRFEKITPAFADVAIPAIKIPVAILIGPSQGLIPIVSVKKGTLPLARDPFALPRTR